MAYHCFPMTFLEIGVFFLPPFPFQRLRWEAETRHQLEMLLFNRSYSPMCGIYMRIPPAKKTCKITQYIPLNKVCMEVIRRSDFPWNTTSSYWGTPWLRKPPKTPRRIRSTALMPSLQQACGWQNNHPNAFRHGNNPRRVQSRGKNGRNKHQMLWIIMGL